MKRKRLTREGWGFERFPYYQLRLDTPFFRGMVGLLRITGGTNHVWHMPKAGRVAVSGAGMTWLQVIPDGERHVLTAKMNRADRVNVWYADVVDGVEPDPDGVAAFTDLYLDVIFSPKGDMKIDDRDELDAAYQCGEVNDAQYAMAIAEGERISRLYCRDTARTERLCRSILREARKLLDDGATLRRNVP